jgi:hypothetical protein
MFDADLAMKLVIDIDDAKMRLDNAKKRGGGIQQADIAYKNILLNHADKLTAYMKEAIGEVKELSEQFNLECQESAKLRAELATLKDTAKDTPKDSAKAAEKTPEKPKK